MVTYFLLEEQPREKYSITALIFSIKYNDPTHNILLACTQETREYIQNLKYLNANIRYRDIDDTFGLAQYAKNWLTIIREEVEKGNELLFCNHNITFVSQFIIPDSIKNQGIGFIKNDFDVCKDNEPLLYNINLLYISSIDVIERLEKHYRDSTTLFIDGKLEWSENEKHEFKVAWSTIPSKFADYDDGVICVNEYFDGKMFLSSENFFAFENAWKLSDMSYKNCLKHKDNDISIVNIRFYTIDERVQKLNKQLLSMTVAAYPYLMASFNLKFSKDGKQDIGYPNEEGLAHWDRTQNKSFYRLIDELVDTGLFNKVNVNADYFVCNNRVLLDKVGVKWITNALKKSFDILTFDTDNEFSEIAAKNDINTTFSGYIPFNRKKLEELEPVDLSEREFDISTPANLDWFIDHEDNLEDYDKLLFDLSLHSHAMITKMTPVSRIAECAYLGVIPIFEEDVIVEGLPELTGDCNNDIICMKSFYHKELSVSAIADKIMYKIFS
jgi:hypothetical protein